MAYLLDVTARLFERSPQEGIVVWPEHYQKAQSEGLKQLIASGFRKKISPDDYRDIVGQMLKKQGGDPRNWDKKLVNLLWIGDVLKGYEPDADFMVDQYYQTIAGEAVGCRTLTEKREFLSVKRDELSEYVEYPKKVKRIFSDIKVSLTEDIREAVQKEKEEAAAELAGIKESVPGVISPDNLNRYIQKWQKQMQYPSVNTEPFRDICKNMYHMELQGLDGYFISEAEALKTHTLLEALSPVLTDEEVGEEEKTLQSMGKYLDVYKELTHESIQTRDDIDWYLEKTALYDEALRKLKKNKDDMIPITIGEIRVECYYDVLQAFMRYLKGEEPADEPSGYRRFRNNFENDRDTALSFLELENGMPDDELLTALMRHKLLVRSHFPDMCILTAQDMDLQLDVLFYFLEKQDFDISAEEILEARDLSQSAYFDEQIRCLKKSPQIKEYIKLSRQKEGRGRHFLK